MKRKKWICALLALVMVLGLFGCANTLAESQPAEIPQPDGTGDGEKMTLLWREVWSPKDIVPSAAEHGEDYSIVWTDAGLEARIRLLLGRETGDILHSDVWEIQSLLIEDTSCSMATELDGTGDPVATVEKDYDTWNPLPPVETLEDLKHFDRLVRFSVQNPVRYEITLDTTGLEACGELQDLEIWGAVESLNPVGQMGRLKWLTLRQTKGVDLTPLSQLPELYGVYLTGFEVTTLEPFTQISSLRAMILSDVTSCPSLEPLSRTSIEYLSFGLSYADQQFFADLDVDYEPLCRMEQLKWLSLANHPHLEVADCQTLLAESETLRYLNINETPAANALLEGSATLNTDNLIDFIAAPDYPWR